MVKKDTFLYSHNPKSEGARELAKALKIRRIKPQGSAFIPSIDKTIINWGSSALPEGYLKARVLNQPEKVATSSNKLLAFKELQQTVRSVPFTTELETVKEWLSEGFSVCARTILNSSSANGLFIFDGIETFINAKLWTKYIKKKDEFRVHVIGKDVILVQRKAFKKENVNENSQIDKRIRNLDNGYIFSRNDFSVPGDILKQSIESIKTLGLDFGAVDVLWNEKQQQAYVLEVNTAPGLQGSTIEDYANGFEKIL